MRLTKVLVFAVGVCLIASALCHALGENGLWGAVLGGPASYWWIKS